MLLFKADISNERKKKTSIFKIARARKKLEILDLLENAEMKRDFFIWNTSEHRLLPELQRTIIYQMYLSIKCFTKEKQIFFPKNMYFEIFRKHISNYLLS